MPVQNHNELACASALYPLLVRLNNMQSSEGDTVEFRQLVHRARRLILRNPFRVFTLRSPPIDMPLERFLATVDGHNMNEMLLVFGFISQIRSFDGDRDIMHHVTAIWPALYDWLYYLCPLMYDFDFGNMDPRRREKLAIVLQRALSAIHYVSILDLSQEMADVVLSPTHNVAQLAAGFFMRGSRVLRSLEPLRPEFSGIKESLLKIPGILMRVLMRTEHQLGRWEVAPSVLFAAAHRHPPRLYNAVGRYLRVLETQDAWLWDAVGMLTVAIFRFAAVPSLSVHRYPTSMIGGLTEILHFGRKHLSPRGTSKAQRVFDLLAQLCATDSHATICAIRYGLLDILLDHGQRLPERSMDSLQNSITHALVSRRSLKALIGPLQDALDKSPPPSIVSIITAARLYDPLLDFTARDWQRVARCANTEVGIRIDAYWLV
ncbi:hypothetical protein K525DRAFT_264518 [Schizophyllum commune Loenen D]|nr:hypothetical protein K525DRAFT_264518 [Schizophyllum commune Loenen D]